MRTARNIALALGALVAGVGAAKAAQAQSATTCGVSGNTAVTIGVYNPFTAVSYTNVPATLTLTRFVGTGGKKTQTVNFVITRSASDPLINISDGSGNNVTYLDTAVPAGVPSINSTASGEIHYNFGGASQPDTSAPIPILVSIPSGQDLLAGPEASLDIRFVCKGTGGFADISSPQTLFDVIKVKVTVPSALQAYFAGTALDFGEIGTYAANLVGTTTAQTRRTGNLNVASTGPYTVSVTSTNGYRMTYPGGSLTPGSPQNVRYSMRFLGQTRDSASPTFSTVTCNRASITGQNLPIAVDLQEGGTGKTAAPNYQDTLNVTFTPLAVPPAINTIPGVHTNCPALT